MQRTFGILLEINHGREVDRVSEFVDFDEPESLGPDRTLMSIAVCRVETALYADAAFKQTGKNWKVVAVTEV